MEKLLIINPGSTSTKIAVYEDEKAIFVESISHDSATISKYDNIVDQYEFRKDLILETLKEKGVNLSELTGIVSRGGLLPPIEAGAYRVNEDMVWQLKNAPQNEHASNLGAIIAHSISQECGIPAFIYDGVTVDEMLPILKITGLPDMRRKGLGHNLNMRAAAMRYAKENNKSYEDCSVVVAHLGGGISVSLHTDGIVADIVNDEEGPFSPERTGGLPLFQVIDMATSGLYDKKSMMKIVKNKGGLVAYFGVNDARDVEKMIAGGDGKAKLVYEAMALNVAKFIASESAVVNGKVEAIILTGGMAYSELFAGLIKERIEFIAPVIIYGGENEMESLALGGLRVLRGEERAKEFQRSV
jgi:butyrate kinase